MHVPSVASVGHRARLATSGFAAVTIPSLPLPAASAVTTDMVTVGNAGNAADTTGYGAIGRRGDRRFHKRIGSSGRSPPQPCRGPHAPAPGAR
jgi:hypothetical protein